MEKALNRSFQQHFRPPNWVKPHDLQKHTNLWLKALEDAISVQQAYYTGLLGVEQRIHSLCSLVGRAINNPILNLNDHQALRAELANLDAFVQGFTFQGLPLLNGHFCPQLECAEPGIVLIAVNGLPQKTDKPLVLEIITEALPNRIIGVAPATEKLWQAETALEVEDEGKKLVFPLQPHIAAEEKLSLFQTALQRAEIDLSARIQQGFLHLTRLEKGLKPSFSARSLHTSLISAKAGLWENSIPGQDMQALLDQETVACFGNYLYSGEHNPNAPGLLLYVHTAAHKSKFTLYWSHLGVYKYQAEHPGCFVLPSLQPRDLGKAFPNLSGFQNLSHLELTSHQHKLDSQKLLRGALERLQSLKRDAKECSTQLMSQVMALIFHSQNLGSPKEWQMKVVKMAEEIQKISLKSPQRMPKKD